MGGCEGVWVAGWGVGGVGGAHMCTCVHSYMHVMGDVTLQE